MGEERGGGAQCAQCAVCPVQGHREVQGCREGCYRRGLVQEEIFAVVQWCRYMYMCIIAVVEDDISAAVHQ